jgi:hypothetical protein
MIVGKMIAHRGVPDLIYVEYLEWKGKELYGGE